MDMVSLQSVREELIAYIAKETRVPKDEARKTLSTVLSGIVQLLKDGKRLRLVDFGTFSVQEILERKGRNPRTGEHIQIAAHKRLTFKPGQAFKKAVNPIPTKASLKKEKAKKTAQKKSS
jgi:DNA-binding protein HU-beta